jgi:two-component system, NtrC family, response regulator PilR
MQPIRDLVSKVAGTNTTVLLRGESGVGKEVVARAIHKASPRASRQFLKVNCAALPGELLESELFGHEKGAFTGAYRQKPGKFEAADEGTLLLDEIGEMPLRLQAKLLHVLQDGEFSRVGGEKIIGTDVRLIAATNRDLEASMRAHQFREDLYYRLNVIEIRIPPLRERREEIAPLVDHFLRKFNGQYVRNVDVPAETLRAFLEYHWPGNIRELENVIERAIVLGSSEMIDVDTLPVPLRQPPDRQDVSLELPPEGLDLESTLDRIEQRYMQMALDRVGGVQTRAAELLRVSFRQFRYKLQKFQQRDTPREG